VFIFDVKPVSGRVIPILLVIALPIVMPSPDLMPADLAGKLSFCLFNRKLIGFDRVSDAQTQTWPLLLLETISKKFLLPTYDMLYIGCVYALPSSRSML
jgi:hypothetical protein